jgi:signal transduction histidine kinase
VARAGRSRAEVVGPIRDDAIRAGAWGLLAAGVALVASALVSRRIARGLRALELHADALGRGEQPAHAIVAPAEVARLGRAFDAMAARLLAARAARDRLTADIERQRAFYEKTFRAAPAGMAVLDGRTLRVRWANPAYLAFLDEPHRSAGIDGRSLEEFVPRARELGLIALFEQVARDGAPYENARYRLDGLARGTAWFSWSLRPVEALEGEGTDLLLLVSDITEQVSREMVLEAGAVIGQSLRPEEVADRIARVAVPGLADGCAIDVLGEDGALAQLALAHVDPEWERRARAERGARLAGGGSPAARAIEERRPVVVPRISRGELEPVAQDPAHPVQQERGGPRALIAVPLLVRGEPIGALTLLSCASGRLFRPGDVAVAEELARRAAQALDSARLFEATQRAVRHRDEVLAVVSHDLRTPLATVLMGASALAATAERGDLARPKVLATAQRIRGAGDRMSRMVGDLLDLASIEEGRLALAPGPCAPADLVREAVEQARAAADEKGLDLGWEAAPELPRVRCDSGRVLQVLGNLISNAIKAAESGFVLVRAVRGDGEVRLEVADSGPGIPAEDLPYIFDRFRRGQNASYRGTGLGLAIARGIVAAHGGRIWAESRVGAGTRVFFTVPAEAAAAPAAAGGARA